MSNISVASRRLCYAKRDNIARSARHSGTRSIARIMRMLLVRKSPLNWPVVVSFPYTSILTPCENHYLSIID